jgi:hypothetical protein
MNARKGAGHYRNLAKRGKLLTSPASPKGSRHSINAPKAIYQASVRHGFNAANLALRPNSIQTLNPGRK